ncbi:MAG TPA: carbohydrate kinase family protein, partial [Pyrinomonadaceae bacterium]|nr:carbohydrate kinase family protein [Pyrinomonadaceae bacterium]
MRFPFRLPEEAEFDVIGFGTNAVDHLIRVPIYPPLDSKIELIEHIETPGGEVASTLVGLQRLGFKTLYAGRFGGDSAGEIGIASLAAEGVDISDAEIIAAARTQIAFILVDDQSGERTVIWQRDSRLAYSADEAPVNSAPKAKILHMTAHDPPACVQMARAARAHGLIVSLDVDNVFPDVSALLPSIDICLTSAGFLENFLGTPDPRTAISEIASRYGCSVVGCTNGSAGSILWCGNTFIQTKAF